MIVSAQYQEFTDGVMRRAGVATTQEAREASTHALEALAQHLDGLDREQVASVLPPTLRDAIVGESSTPEGSTAPDLVQEMSRRASCPPERARYLLEAVLSEIVTADPALGESLRHRLPQEFAPLFAAPGQGPPPDLNAAAAEDKPRPLDPDELERALDQLENWRGSTAGISREISLPQDRQRPLLARVRAAEEELSHHVNVTHPGAELVRFEVRTRSLGSVTELDMRLAARIDEAIRAVGSGG
ncbi:DUF2267 domain-containing protein [Saccharopolyspora endophytica]|uniref:DUF2267 domain-containing protein n=1 Tax=Saccharopolyspora endophytica TaxID=543886 RepID=UPI001FE82EBD|nr:DUF2267 domain-containing protein [Saccharopolyspora endophytica]